ncbi:hypothetical protein MGSAQ_001674 [marine sediment metagenome]|uniref:Uncharacterized protein n=1 Tax=marine sediment metagenome TaxID=412755 RepID=A0A1B6NTL4_9ZZZZ
MLMATYAPIHLLKICITKVSFTYRLHQRLMLTTHFKIRLTISS